MSHRGTKALRESEWQSSQYKDGKRDALKGRTGSSSDQYYQRGWRDGLERLSQLEKEGECAAAIDRGDFAQWCGRINKADWLDSEFSGEWVGVCGIHARVAERQGRVVKWRK